jgi:hypothetical protein
MTTNGYASAPSARAIMSAALTNMDVMMPTEGSPRRSPMMASCKLHDEQLPQSPMPEMRACHLAASWSSPASAGAL